MRLGVADREVVDPDEPRAALDEVGSAVAAQLHGTLGIGVAGPQLGVAGAKQQPLRIGQVEGLQRMAVERTLVRARVDDLRRADQHVERERVDAGSAAEEVGRRVHVRPGVGAELEARQLDVVPRGQLGHATDADDRVAGIGDHAFAYGNGDVEDLHRPPLGGDRTGVCPAAGG